MQLEGSCQCGAVRFTVESDNPYPYQHCYCSICRKTQGGSGAAVNLSAASATLVIEGEQHLKRYHAHIRTPGQDDTISTAERCFCGECGSALWLFSPEWPELLHPSPRPSTRRCRYHLNARTSCSRSSRSGCRFPPDRTIAWRTNIPRSRSLTGTKAGPVRLTSALGAAAERWQTETNKLRGASGPMRCRHTNRSVGMDRDYELRSLLSRNCHHFVTEPFHRAGRPEHVSWCA